MASTTFVATTADGATVVRTSSTREYTHLVLGTKDGQPEGAISWHGDRVNAEKAASTWSTRGMKTRVIPVEQTLHGKAAKAAIEAAKTGTTDVAVTPPAAPVEPVVAEKAEAGATTRRTKAKAAQATTAAPEQVLAGLAERVRAAQAALAAAMGERDATVATMLAEKVISGPKAADAMGVTTMAVYNMRNRAQG